jgi:predicted ArsR family transcriptional regulator
VLLRHGAIGDSALWPSRSREAKHGPHGVYAVGRVEGSILELLERHGSLGYEQIAAHLNLPPDQVRNALTDLRARGWIEALKIGDHPEPNGPAYWHLTSGGHEELARRRRAG